MTLVRDSLTFRGGSFKFIRFKAQMQEDTEDIVVVAAQRGDLAAFNQLVTWHEQRVYNLTYRMLNDAEAAADATQDAFWQAYRALAQYRGGSFKSWLLRIASNICYDRLRSRNRRPTSSLDALIEDAEQVGGADLALLEDPHGDPVDHATRRELARELAQALRSLPDEQRLAVVLSDVQGMSYDEIVAITGASLGTVKSRISRGRLKMRDYIQKNKELLPRDLRS
jgi:RNA polymerase sigma-70 factor (ECF subfamily)